MAGDVRVGEGGISGFIAPRLADERHTAVLLPALSSISDYAELRVHYDVGVRLLLSICDRHDRSGLVLTHARRATVWWRSASAAFLAMVQRTIWPSQDFVQPRLFVFASLAVAGPVLYWLGMDSAGMDVPEGPPEQPPLRRLAVGPCLAFEVNHLAIGVFWSCRRISRTTPLDGP